MNNQNKEMVTITFERYNNLRERNEFLEKTFKQLEKTALKNVVGDISQPVDIDKQQLIDFLQLHFGYKNYVQANGAIHRAKYEFDIK
ncbi:TPA: hypothetical protein ACXDAB_003447 [Clostridium botulinum]|uniref:hypothetical protein n=1 Tax=Clostridium botulinum TaxID=1491 RepID=UPI001D626C31|nr:hypothetical protein [Clostridium botulinum]MCR1167316.1 hypothetical protein [Clostridium botulinum]HBJ1682526.1 hypothetical protein [Clostridium botulinum]HBJ2607793.1 hypothetical protein [Clostridium botulinum]HDI3019146.1 hypothetical protein [Clostridium botulinum]